MTPTFLHVDFDYAGPCGEALAAACSGLADDIAAEPGLRWKLWTENEASGRAGGAYLFDTRADADRYLAKHLPRLRAFGVQTVRSQCFDVNPVLSARTRVPLGSV